MGEEKKIRAKIGFAITVVFFMAMLITLIMGTVYLVTGDVSLAELTIYMNYTVVVLLVLLIII